MTIEPKHSNTDTAASSSSQPSNTDFGRHFEGLQLSPCLTLPQSLHQATMHKSLQQQHLAEKLYLMHWDDNTLWLVQLHEALTIKINIMGDTVREKLAQDAKQESRLCRRPAEQWCIQGQPHFPTFSKFFFATYLEIYLVHVYEKFKLYNNLWFVNCK